jgi:formylglycine-generating enzyme required for sulfatase activity
MAFCEWLSARTGERFTLPTEAEWEWACRAGTATPFSFGDADADYSTFANLGDVSLRLMAVKGVNPKPISKPNSLEDFIPKDTRFDDRNMIVAEGGKYKPNAWGLCDMHGNVAEWTLSTFRPYPYQDGDGRNKATSDGEKVVRGGSWRDRPKRCRSAFRLHYPAWQPVFNVGFRVVCPVGGGKVALTQ